MISFRAHTYYQISNYLNRKYLYPNNLINSSKLRKTNISLYFIQFHREPFHNELINKLIDILEKKYSVHINQNNPDYLIYNVFGCQYLDSRYNNSINI